MLNHILRRHAAALLLSRRACSTAASAAAQTPGPPAVGTIGGPSYSASSAPSDASQSSAPDERDSLGRRISPRTGVLSDAAASSAASAVPLFDPRWAGPGDGGSGTQSSAPTPVAAKPLRFLHDTPPPPVAPRVASKKDARPVLSAASFSPSKLRALGVGGLDAELTALFRRAFASRAMAPGVAAAMGVSHVKGVLLHGPPGTGKTLVARTLGELLASGKAPKVINGPELLSRWVGSSEENVRSLFADAEADWKKNGEGADLHVLIFDEIDALCRARGGGGGGGASAGSSVGDSVVNQLLTKIDGVHSAPNVLIIGITNRRDLLDAALLRPGRLEVQLEIGLPDAAGRRAILGIHTGKLSAAGLLAADVDVDAIAERTRNYSGAELAGVVRAASSFAMERLLRVPPPDGGDDTATHGAHGRGLGLGRVSVTAADFSAALLEVRAALGTASSASGNAAACATSLLGEHSPDGLLDLGKARAAPLERIAALASLLHDDANVDSETSEHAPPPAPGSSHHHAHHAHRRRSPRGAMRAALLLGPPGCGRSSLARAAADATSFPFARVVSASPAAAAASSLSSPDGSDPLASALVAAFADAHKSPASVLVLDDVERLIGWSPVGPAYSNAALQALLQLLRTPPPAGRKLLVVATSGAPDAMAALGLASAFDVVAPVAPLDATDAATALQAAGAFGDRGAAEAAARALIRATSAGFAPHAAPSRGRVASSDADAGADSGSGGVPIKRLLSALALARRGRRGAAVTADAWEEAAGLLGGIDRL